MSTAYSCLLEQFCELAGISEVERVLEQGAIEMDDVLFSVFHYPAEDADLLLLYCDYGPFPDSTDNIASARLLALNMLFSASAHAIAFARNPENGNVVQTWRLPLEGLTAEDLFQRMKRCARQAQEWQRSHFHEVDPADVIAGLVGTDNR